MATGPAFCLQLSSPDLDASHDQDLERWQRNVEQLRGGSQGNEHAKGGTRVPRMPLLLKVVCLICTVMRGDVYDYVM